MSLVERWMLPNCTPLTLRPICLQDSAGLEELILALSLRDRRWRFHVGVAAVPAEWLRRLVAVDPPNQVALVVTAQTARQERLIAEARFAMDENGQDAEFALMVDTAWRRLGVATRAMAALQRVAADSGVRRLHGSVLADNAPMLNFVRRCGFRCKTSRVEPTLVDVEMPLARPPGSGLSRPSALSGPLADAFDVGLSASACAS